AIVQDPALSGPTHTTARRAKMKAIVYDRFGFDEMARRAPGPNRGGPGPAAPKGDVRLFPGVRERSVIGRIEGHHGEPIDYTSESVDGDQATVRSTISNRAGDRTEIDYRLIRTGDKWEVYDLVIDGISTVNNYRMQFGQILRSQPPEKL